MNNPNSTLQRIKESIHSSDPNAEAYLFGSRARGDNRPDSDWDIIILVDNKKVTNEIHFLFRRKLNEIEIETGEIFSLLIYPKEFWQNKLIFSPLYRNVKKEGIPL